MKSRVIALVLVLALVSNALLLAAEEQAPENDNPASKEQLTGSQSYQEGRLAAKREHSAGGWVVGGILGGGFFSLLGAGAVTGIAAASSPSPDYVPENVEAASYMSGYEKEARAKNVRGAAISGGVMTVLWIAIVASAY